jgi:hypothetical protein
MQVVDSAHAIHFEQGLYHRVHVHTFRGAFQQDMNRLAQNSPRIPQNEEADQHADKWVEPIPTREGNNNTRHNRSERGQHVAHQV